MEIWKNIPGYQNRYQASNLGRIRSCPRPRVLKYRILSLQDNQHGYKQVSFWSKACQGNRSTPIHRLVALAFLPNPHNFTDVHHKDKNRHNNTVDNLQWCSKTYNLADVLIQKLKREQDLITPSQLEDLKSLL